jgi:hypothetical protein
MKALFPTGTRCVLLIAGNIECNVVVPGLMADFKIHYFEYPCAVRIQVLI